MVQSHCSKYEKVDPEFARKVTNHFYLDYRNTGVYSTEEGFEFYIKIKVRFLEATFMLESGKRMTKIYAN